MSRPAVLQVITNSELETWRTCPARWGFAYGEKLRPKVPALVLTFGTLHHAGAAAGWRTWTPDQSIDTRLAAALSAYPAVVHEQANEAIRTIEAEAGRIGHDTATELCTEVEEARDTALWTVRHYFEQCRADLAYVPVLIEEPYTVKIPNRAGVGGTLVQSGKIDLVLWDQETGRLITEDHKTTGADVSGVERRVELDTQLTGYVVALRVLRKVWADNLVGYVSAGTWDCNAAPFRSAPAGARNVMALHADEFTRATVGSIAYNVARRARPAAPKLNLLRKNQAITTALADMLRAQEQDGVPRGEVSVAAIDTLPGVYRDALVDQELGRELTINDKQRDLLARLEAKGDSFFRQIEFWRGDAEIERWRAELWVEARRIRHAQADVSLRTRNPLACSAPRSPRCAYASVCMAPDSPEARTAFRVANTEHEELKDEHSEDPGTDEELGF